MGSAAAHDMSRVPLILKIRSEIALGPNTLRDHLTGSVYVLDELGHAIINVLRVPMTADAVIDTVARSKDASTRSKVERELRRMLLLGVFEGTCNFSRARLRRLREGEMPELSVLSGSRFGCQHSGGCCRGYLFGYLTATEKERIESLNPRALLQLASETPLFIEAGASLGKPLYRLASVADACVFLQKDRRCALHSAFGPTAKPAFCQLFPLAAYTTIEGFKVYDRGECASFATSANAGTLLAEEGARIRSLVRDDIYHPVVHVHGPWRCEYGLIALLARRCDQEASARAPLYALHAIGQLSRRFVMALARCPFQEGQPESLLTEILTQPLTGPAAAETETASAPESGLSTLALLAEALAARVVTQETGVSFSDIARVLAEICRSGPGCSSLSEIARRALSTSVGGDSERVLRLSLRQQIFGREFLLDDDLPAGLLRMVFALALTLVGARLNAVAAREATVTLPHISAGHVTVRRALHRPSPHELLKANGEQVWPILEALPLLSKQIGLA